MATLDAIRVKNLRSLVDTGWIDQKLITVLVGKNSAGKSTFARVFPLLRQSFSEKKQSPILWFGQLVDFGQFSVAVHNKSPHAPIVFAFRVSIAPADLERANPYQRALSRLSDIERMPVEVEMALVEGRGEDSADTVVQSIAIRILDFSVDIEFSSSGTVTSLNVDGINVWRVRSGFLSFVDFDSAIPTLHFYKERRETTPDVANTEGVYLEDFDPFGPTLSAEVRRYVHGNLGEDKLRQITARLTFASLPVFLERALIAGSDQRMWLDHITSAKNNPEKARSLHRAALIAKLPALLKIINSTLANHFGAVKYIEPLRATAQRYYRKQDLAIGEIDTKGANVAQFLQSLPYWRRQEFDEISKRLFGFTVQPRVQGGHIELLLRQTGGASSVNMADAGVGFSQLLPILLQLWAFDEEGVRPRLASSIKATVVMEQPELHLHPAYQATLADLFCEIVAHAEGTRSKIIAETHSPALVNRLGALVAAQKIAANQVQVLLFEQDNDLGVTAVRVATFDKDGVLQNWPFGFFEPEI